MKLELQNYAVIIWTEISNIKFNSNNVNSLRIYDTAQNHRILLYVVQGLYQHNLKISKYRHIEKHLQGKLFK
jgi:hypothetical protein